MIVVPTVQKEIYFASPQYILLHLYNNNISIKAACG